MSYPLSGCKLSGLCMLSGRHFDLSVSYDLSLGVSFDGSVQAYGVSNPTKRAYKVGEFVGSVRDGGSCNCFEVHLNPHCHTTHTECVSHVLKDMKPIAKFLNPFFALAQVVSVEDGKIDKSDLKNLDPSSDISALVIRTLPNQVSKKTKQYDGQASFLTPQAIKHCLEYKFDHILVDFPSIDPMFDEGKLLAHRVFWDMEPDQVELTPSVKTHRSITELIYVPCEVKDAVYGLNLTWVDYAMDAVPSRPLLYPEVML